MSPYVTVTEPADCFAITPVSSVNVFPASSIVCFLGSIVLLLSLYFIIFLFPVH